MASAKSTGKVLLVSAFMILGVTGLVAGLTASACRSPMYSGAKKLRFCSISISAGSVFPGQAAKRSILYLERGIAQSDLGRKDAAVSDFQDALRSAIAGDFVRSSNQTIFYNYKARLNERIEAAGAVARANFSDALEGLE